MAARILEKGGIIAYPTEAVYGLGCLPENRDAVYRLLSLKKRSMCKGLILVAASPEQLEKYIYYPDTCVRERVLATWPGPVTLTIFVLVGRQTLILFPATTPRPTFIPGQPIQQTRQELTG